VVFITSSISRRARNNRRTAGKKRKLQKRSKNLLTVLATFDIVWKLSERRREKKSRGEGLSGNRLDDELGAGRFFWKILREVFLGKLRRRKKEFCRISEKNEKGLDRGQQGMVI
jgi:hypothetical protein